MKELERQILDVLVQLERTVKSIRTSEPKPCLQSLFSRLEDLTRRLPRDTNPDLLHYLHKKSYERARIFLEGDGASILRGSC